MRNKTEILAELTPLPKGLAGRLEVAKFQVRVTGDVAIATHRLTSEISETIRCADGKLLGTRTGRPEVAYLAEMTDVFFAPGKPRTRRIFLRDAAGAVTGFADRREGIDVRWTKVKEEK